MKGKFWRKALAVATSVLMLSGGLSVQPFADIFKGTAITAYAQGTEVDLSTLTGSYTAQDGDILSGTTSQIVNIADNADITLSGATINGGIICNGSATITLVGTNSVTGAAQKAGIQIGGSGTTLTIKGNGSLTVTGGEYSAGIGLGSAWGTDFTGGNIVIESGNITATGGAAGAGIGTGALQDYESEALSVSMGDIVVNGGTVTANGGSGAGIGAGYVYGFKASSLAIGKIVLNGGEIAASGRYGIGYETPFGMSGQSDATITIEGLYIDTGIELVDATSIRDFENVVYTNNEIDVTANKTDYFTIVEDGDRHIIAPKDNADYAITIADNIENGTLTAVATAKYMETVTVTATPDFGYGLVCLVVKDAQNNDVALTGNTFLMPKGGVTVSAEFAQISHGTTEFKLVYLTGPRPEDEQYESFYDGVTTVNLQQGQSYWILKYDEDSYREFLLDNDIYDVTIPYSGGTGTFTYANGTYFNVDYNGESGYYDIKMTDVGNDKWSVSIQKTVPVVANIPDQTYTGSEIKPEPLVLAGSLSLTKGTDYEYSYSDNTNVGTAKVTVTFKGDYASLGSVEKEFNIVKATPSVTAPTANTLTYNGGDQELVTAGSTNFGKVLYSLDGTNYSEDIPKGTDAGIYTVYYKVDTDNYFYAPQTVTAKISDGIGAMLAGYSLSLDGDIGVNFYMELDDAVVSDGNAYMHFTLPDGSTSDVYLTDTDNCRTDTTTFPGKTYHVFKCNVAAKEMTDTIKAQMIDSKKSGKEYTYSVKEYAKEILDHPDRYFPDEDKRKNGVALVKAMLNYGAYSQIYFGHHTEELANDGYENNVEGADVSLLGMWPYDPDDTYLESAGDTTFEGATLSLKSETTLSLYFKSSRDLSFDCYPYEVEKNTTAGGYQIARIRGIKADDLEETFGLNIVDAAESETFYGYVNYCPLTYCYNVLNGGSVDKNLQNVCKALYLYWQAANEYS